MTSPIRVLITEDHPVVRTGLRAMLVSEPDIALAGEATSGADAVTLLRDEPFDVVLMDLRMPDEDGIAVIPRILAIRPDTRIIMLSTYEKVADIQRAPVPMWKPSVPRREWRRD